MRRARISSGLRHPCLDLDILHGVLLDAEGHRFWDQTAHTWTRAADLTSKAHLRTANGGTTMLLSGATPKVTTGDMWNLTVQVDHTYYVLAGNTPVLVHNSCGLGSGVKNSSAGLKDIFGDSGVRGRSIIDVRSELLDDGFSQGLTRNRKGYLFQNEAGEEVRIMRRGDGWDIRVRNADGSYLDEFGNVANPADTHGIELNSR